MRLINLIGLFLLLLSFAVEGQNLAILGCFSASKRNSGFVIYLELNLY